MPLVLGLPAVRFAGCQVLDLMPDSRAHLLRMRIRRAQTAQTEIGNKDDTAKLALEDFRYMFATNITTD